jgi:hypothetical protein
MTAPMDRRVWSRALSQPGRPWRVRLPVVVAPALCLAALP